MLSAVLLAGRMRPIIPLAVMGGASIPAYFSCVGWRLISLPLPQYIYNYVDDYIWGFYQRLCLFFFENISGVQISFYGDALECFKKKETVLYMCNHQCTVDWLVADMLAIRQGTLGGLRYILKDTLQYVPLFGWYFYQHGCVYVRRRGKFRPDITNKQLDYLANYPYQFWLVLFPEGTRFNPSKPKVLEGNRQFALSQGYEPLNHVFVPRVRGLQMALERIRSKLDAIYDITICYSAARDNNGKQIEAPSMTDFVCGPPGTQLHINVDRIPISDVPLEEDLLKQWCYEKFLHKDKLLSKFYSVDFDSVKNEIFPNRVTREAVLPLSETLIPTVFFCATLAPLLWSPALRKFYGFSWIIGTLASIAWMKICKGA